MVDANLCEKFEISDCGPLPISTQTPTQTLTNSETPTETPTQTQTPTNTETPTTTPTPTLTPGLKDLAIIGNYFEGSIGAGYSATSSVPVDANLQIDKK
jgi:hypothetical protein